MARLVLHIGMTKTGSTSIEATFDDSRDALVAHMRGTFAQLDADAAVGAIVLTGRAPGFCAGSDLKELGTMSLDDMCAHEARTAAFCREIAASLSVEREVAEARLDESVARRRA